MTKLNLTPSINGILDTIKTIKNVKEDISCTRWGDQGFQLNVKKEINPFSFFNFNIHLTINTIALWEEYKKLPEPKKYTQDFTKDDIVMITLIERKLTIILENLKDFNGSHDNYIEIAKLVEITADSSTGKKFGI